MPSILARSVDLLSPRARLGHRIGLAALILIIGCGGLETAAANGETRTLTLHHVHTGEDLTVTFKRNGRYDEEGLKKLNWFLRDWRTDEPTRMDPELFDIVWEVYREVGAKDPVKIISAYRSPKTNAMLRRRGRGVAQFSQHMVGKAMDFYIPNVSLSDLRVAGLRLQRGGVGFYPTSGSPFVHLDTGSIRHWPRMTHDQLARVFPDGRTVHVPSDGQPLRNYALALADVQRRGNRPSQPSLEAARVAGTVDDRRLGASKPNILAKLFGFQQDEDEQEEAAAARPKTVATRTVRTEQTAPLAIRPQVVAEASLIPIPRARPAPSGGSFEVASVESRPVQLRSTEPTPAEIVNSRVDWSEMSAAAPATPALSRAMAAKAAPGASGQRLVWLTGPAPAPRPGADTRVAEARLRAEAAIDTTASVPRWPGVQNDRVPADLALSYAASAAPESDRPSALPDGAPVTQIRRTAAASRPAARPGQRFDDPWLRSITLAPSVHYSLSVAVHGAPDPRYLRTMMVKPRSSVVLTFADEPYGAMSSVRFGGPAVAFLPTVSFDPRQASLH